MIIIFTLISVGCQLNLKVENINILVSGCVTKVGDVNSRKYVCYLNFLGNIYVYFSWLSGNFEGRSPYLRIVHPTYWRLLVTPTVL